MAQHDQSGGTGGGIELVALMDPNEGAFSVHLPRGWQNQAYMVRPHGVPRPVVTSMSPDGAAFLFWGDPQMPAFSEPTPNTYLMAGMSQNPMQQVHPYAHAEPFFFEYVRQRYGAARGFRLTGKDGACPEMERGPMEDARRYGMRARATSISLSFEYADGRTGEAVRARLHGMTFTTGPVWVAEVCGAQTIRDGGDPARYDGLLFQIGRTRRTDPRWQQMQNQGHSQRMGEIQRDHQNVMQRMQSTHQGNMDQIQQSAQSHQARMDDLHAAGDAQLQGWYAQQAASDASHRGFMDTLNGGVQRAAGTGGGEDFSHRRFLNTVTEQETVVGPDGATYQVEAGHERYFRHKRDNTYVGTDATAERDDLRSRFGVNPDDYEEVRIRR